VIKNVFNGKEAYAICLKEDGKAIGAIELKLKGHTDLTDRDDECEMGFWLGKPFWGQGIVPEAVKEMLRHAFEDLGMSKVWIGYYEGNTRSKRVQEKCGFRYQYTSENVDVPLMREKRTGHVSLMTKTEWTTARSLERFGNNDRRIPYYKLRLEQDLDDIKEIGLPPEYHYEYYTSGDRDIWIAIEKSAKEFSSREEGEAAWDRYFAGHEKELENRMFFVSDSSGRKLATATAYYDIHTGDDGGNGWLHWVAVHSDAQGLGLSKPLITHVLAHMKKLGYKKAVIPTQTYTWLACRLYLDLGFVPMKENAEKNKMGWRIIKTLTDHPALDDFETVADFFLIK
jgi:RimJ/RimL family protein N-acetyltransferase